MNRIKALLLGVALSGAALSASAASTYLFDNPENKTYFGARVGVDISSAANGGGFYSNSPGFSLGAVYNIPVFMNLYFEPGLGIFYNTIGANYWDSFTQEVTNEATGVVEEVDVPYQIDGSIRNFGFRIPLLIGYHFDFTEDIKVNVFTGPQLNLSLVSRYHQNEVRVQDNEEAAWSTSVFGSQGFKHADLQWKFGVGISYQKYYLDLSGSWGMTKIMSKPDMSDEAIDDLDFSYTRRDIRRNLFSITLGYNF